MPVLIGIVLYLILVFGLAHWGAEQQRNQELDKQAIECTKQEKMTDGCKILVERLKR